MAKFGSSNTISITLSNDASVGTIEFNAGAPVYSFVINGTPAALSFTGTGIVNNSSNAPTFSTGRDAGMFFHGASTAGNAILMNTGYTEFYDTSTAGNATIINSNGWFTTFWNSSTAGNAMITTNLFTVFRDGSTGGNARFITNAGGIFDISGLTSGGDDGRLNRRRRHLLSGFKVAHRWRQ
jgi:hypothetical protein